MLKNNAINLSPFRTILVICLLSLCPATGMTLVLDLETSTPEEKSDLQIFESLQDFTQFGGKPKLGADDLTDEQKYTVMLSALQTGELAGAVFLAEQISGSYPGDIHVQTVQAIGLINSNERVLAEKLLDGLVPKDKFETASVLLGRALNALMSNNWSDARKHLDDIHELLPNHAYAYVLKAHIQFQSKDYVTAKMYLDKALAINPNMYSALVNAGTLAHEAGDYQLAITYFDRALSNRDEACQARVGKAKVLMTMASFARVPAVVEPCLAKDNVAVVAAVTALAELNLYDQAAEVADKTINNQNAEELRVPAARIALKQGDAEKALEYLAQSKGYAESFSRGLAFLAGKDFTNAATQFSEAVALSNQKAAASFMQKVSSFLASTNENSLPPLPDDQTIEPLVSFTRALYGDPSSAVNALRRNDTHFEQLSFAKIGDDQIESLLAHADKQNLLLGGVFYLLNYNNLAGEYFARSAAVKQDFLSLYMYGFVQSYQQEYASSERYLRTASDAVPETLAPVVLLAEVLLKQGKLGPSLAAFEKAIEIEPQAFVAIKAGMIAERQDDQVKAEAYFRLARSLQPDNPIVLNQLAWFLGQRDKKKVKEGIDIAHSALELSPGSANILDTLGWLYHLDGQNVLAKETLEKAMALNQQSSHSVLYHLAIVEKSLGNVDRAHSLLIKVANSDKPSKYTPMAGQALKALPQGKS